MVPDLDSLQQMLEQAKPISKQQQRMVIMLRLKGEVSGARGHFYTIIKDLMKAGWVEKHAKYNENGRPEINYKLTSKGMEFNSRMMQFPSYRAIWDAMPKKTVFSA